MRTGTFRNVLLGLHVRGGRAVPRGDVFSLGVPSQFTRKSIYSRLMACLRKIGLESVDLTVQSDNEPASVSLSKSWGTTSAERRTTNETVELVL